MNVDQEVDRQQAVQADVQLQQAVDQQDVDRQQDEGVCN